MAQELPHSTLENHPDHVKAIGMITIEMSNLDMSLGEMLGGLLTVPPTVGRTIYQTAPELANGK